MSGKWSKYHVHTNPIYIDDIINMLEIVIYDDGELLNEISEGISKSVDEMMDLVNDNMTDKVVDLFKKKV